jgi:putative aldouronate transport system permease protein
MISSKGDKVFQIVLNIFMILITLYMIMPFVLLLMSSITDENTLIADGYSFFPKKFSFQSYEYIFQNGSTLFKAYGITILVTAIGTTLGIIMTCMLAYGLSLKELPGRTFFNFYVFFTMLFNGGLVPTYLMYTHVLHIKDTLFAQIVPSLLLNAVNVLLVRTFFSNNIPKALLEAAQIDGASQFTVFNKIVLPLGKPIIVTIGLFTGLGYWNDWLNGLYYLNNSNLYNIQNFLNRMMSDAEFLSTHSFTSSSGAAMRVPTLSVRMAIAFIAILPVLIIYPFLQKYFENGITLGAVKG